MSAAPPVMIAQQPADSYLEGKWSIKGGPDEAVHRAASNPTILRDLAARPSPMLNLQWQLSRLNLLIIDELGFVPLYTTGAELLFEVFSQRYERGSILVTTNLPFDEWTEVFGSERLTGA